jgi:hypothetical protein
MRRRAPVTQHGIRSAGEDRSHPAPLGRQPRMADRVHPAMDGVKPPARDPAIDRIVAEPERHELAAGDDAVLARCKAGDPSLVWTGLRTCATLTAY